MISGNTVSWLQLDELAMYDPMSPSPSSEAAVSLRNWPPHRNITKVGVRADTAKYYHILQQAPSASVFCDTPSTGALLYGIKDSSPRYSQRPLYMGAPRQAVRAYRAVFASRNFRNRDGAVSKSRRWSRCHLAYALGCTAAEIYLASSCMVKDIIVPFLVYDSRSLHHSALGHDRSARSCSSCATVQLLRVLLPWCAGTPWEMGQLHLKRQHSNASRAQLPGGVLLPASSASKLPSTPPPVKPPNSRQSACCCGCAGVAAKGCSDLPRL